MSALGARQLVSWKEIADYLGRDVRTVVRWEKDKHLPVHRVPGGKRQSVFAYTNELDAWLRGDGGIVATAVEASEHNVPPPLLPPLRAPVQRRIRRAEWAMLIAVALISFSLLGFLFRPQSRPGAPLHLVRLSLDPGIAAGAALSPDGREVAYTFRRRGDPRWHAYIQLIGAGNPVRVTQSDVHEGNPAWSPDGRFLAFATGNDESESLVVVPARGGVPRVVAHIHDPHSMYYVAWTPDGRGLVYPDRDSEDEPVTTWKLGLDTGERTRFLSAPDLLTVDYRGQFSPDGKYFAFFRGTASYVGDFYVMPAGGGEPRKVTGVTSPGVDFAWTADSRELVFQHPEPNNGSNLYRVSITGGEATPALATTASVFSPSIARTGAGLVFLQFQDDTNIWRIDLGKKAASPTAVADSPERDVDPACSPDARRLAFLSYRGGGADLWLSDVQGGNLQRLTYMSGTVGANSGTPDWSPDGRSIAFSSTRNRQNDVSLVDVASGDVHHLTTHPANDRFPRWSRDGKSIYFTSDRSGRNEIWRMAADGSAALQITQHGGLIAQESPDGKTLYFGKELSDGLWSMPVAGGPEKLEIAVLRRRFAWTMSDTGIYFASGSAFPGMAVHYYDFATGGLTHAFEPDRFLQLNPAKLSACRNNKTLFVTQGDILRSELIWAENFK